MISFQEALIALPEEIIKELLLKTGGGEY